MTAQHWPGGGPRIERVTASAYVIPTDRPEADGTLGWDSTTVVLVEVTAGGERGIGWTYGPGACMPLVNDQLSAVVENRGAWDVTAAYHAMVAAARNLPRAGTVSMAIAAVDTALWDLKARLVGLPLHRLLGAVHDRVPVYGSGGFTTYDDDTTAAQLQGWADEGITAVKIKIGESWGTRVDRDLARVALARRTVGSEVELLVDANGGYQVGQAVRVGAALDELDVRWFEEPVTSDDLDGLRRVRDGVGADVTAGEYGFDLSYFTRMCAAGAVDCLQVDVTRCGGITEWQRIAAVAGAHHLEVSGHCAPALHVAVAAATPNLRHLEYFHDHVRIESMLFDGLPELRDGALVPGDAPGNGLTPRAEELASYRVSA